MSDGHLHHWTIEAYNRKDGIVLFNDALNTFYLLLHGVKHMAKDHSDSKKKTHCCHFMGYFFQFAARDLLYIPSNSQDSTYHGLWYTSCRTLDGLK